MTPAELVKKAIENSAAGSARKLAAQLDIDHTRLTMWANEDRELRFEEAMLLADAAGLPPVKTAAELRSGRAKGKQLSALLHRLSKVAALCVVAGAVPHYTNAKSVIVHNVDNCNFTHSGQTIHSHK